MIGDHADRSLLIALHTSQTRTPRRGPRLVEPFFASDLSTMSNSQKKGKVYRQPHDPPTPEANVHLVVLGSTLAGIRPLKEFVNT